MNRYKRKLVHIVFFLLFSSILYPVTVVINDSRVYEGILVFISEEKIILEKDGFFFEIQTADIDILINPPSSEHKGEPLIITFTTANGIITEGELIRATSEFIYIFSKTDEKMTLFNYSLIRSLTLKTTREEQDISNGGSKEQEKILKKITVKKKELTIEERFNILLTSLYLLDDLATSQDRAGKKLTIMDPDFYEIFWNEIERYIGPQTKEIIWNLIEIYYEKEIILFHILKEDGIRFDDNYEFLIEVRNEFFNRAKKIIITLY